MNRIKGVYWMVLGAVLATLAGCAKSGNPVGSQSGMSTVQLSAVFSKGGTAGLAKLEGTSSDSTLRIDSAIVVFQRIKFEAHIDSVSIDSTGQHDSDDDGHDDEVVFKGPFAVHVRDTSTINFASQVLPAGTYDGIKFKIHRIGWGERFEDSDDLMHGHQPATDTTLPGSSIIVWGRVLKNGSLVPFTYRFNGEIEYKLKGNFTVSSATSVVNIALRFNMGAWFVNPRTGAALDPTDTSPFNRFLIDWAIRQSFQNGKSGRDRDGRWEWD